MKETILGNYLNFPRFPLDCESIAYLQANTQLLSVIARLSGCDKLILSGCDITSGSTRAEGYVYIRTGNDLVGEVVYFKGGTGTRCKIVPTNFDVTANGETFRNAYTKRVLESSSSPSDMAWGDFTKLSDISNAALKTAVDGKSSTGHNHDDRYYTETEIDSKLNGKSNVGHTHNYATTEHRHGIDDVQGLRSTLNGKASTNHTHDYAATGHSHGIDDVQGLRSQLDGKENTGHNHDGRYYTESEIDTKLNGKSNTGHNHDERYYTESEIDTKLNGKSNTGHNHDTAYSPIDHDHDTRYYTETEIDNKLAVTIDTHKAHLEFYKQGRVVYVRISAYTAPKGFYENSSSIFEVIPSEFRPIANYHGVGMVYFGSDALNQPNSSNLVPFRITTGGSLSTMCYQNNATFEGSACYISAS